MGAGPGPGIQRNPVRLPGNGGRAREGIRSGASLFKELRSSLRGAAGIRDSGTLKIRMRCQMPASRPASGQAGAESRGEYAVAGAGAAGRLLRSPGTVP